MSSIDYSFEKGITTDQEYDNAIALISEFRKKELPDTDASVPMLMLRLATMIEKYERERYLIFYHGFTC